MAVQTFLSLQIQNTNTVHIWHEYSFLHYTMGSGPNLEVIQRHIKIISKDLFSISYILVNVYDSPGVWGIHSRYFQRTT